METIAEQARSQSIRDRGAASERRTKVGHGMLVEIVRGLSSAVRRMVYPREA